MFCLHVHSEFFSIFERQNQFHCSQHIEWFWYSLNWTDFLLKKNLKFWRKKRSRRTLTCWCFRVLCRQKEEETDRKMSKWNIKHYKWPVREDKKTFKEEDAIKMDNQNLQTIFSLQLKNHQLEHLEIPPFPIGNPREQLEKGHNGNQNAMMWLLRLSLEKLSLFILVHRLCNDAETTRRLSAGSPTTSKIHPRVTGVWIL